MYTYRLDYTQSERGYYDDYYREDVRLVRKNMETGEEIYIDPSDLVETSSWGGDTIKLDITNLPGLFQKREDERKAAAERKLELERISKLATAEQLRKYGEIPLPERRLK